MPEDADVDHVIAQALDLFERYLSRTSTGDTLTVTIAPGAVDDDSWSVLSASLQSRGFVVTRTVGAPTFTITKTNVQPPSGTAEGSMRWEGAAEGRAALPDDPDQDIRDLLQDIFDVMTLIAQQGQGSNSQLALTIISLLLAALTASGVLPLNR